MTAPDVLHPGFAVGAVHLRVVAHGDREIGDVVLDQRVVSGIVNIYESEGLFRAAIEPRQRTTYFFPHCPSPPGR